MSFYGYVLKKEPRGYSTVEMKSIS